jgi:hypothetical protein
MGTELDRNSHVCRNALEFNGSNGKQGCFYQSKLQGSGSAIPDSNAQADPNTDSNYGDIITNIGIAHSNSYPYANANSNANPDSNRNAPT